MKSSFGDVDPRIRLNGSEPLSSVTHLYECFKLIVWRTLPSSFILYLVFIWKNSLQPIPDSPDANNIESDMYGCLLI